MNDRRAQWLRFYEAALAGSADTLRGPHAGEDANDIAYKAERIADAAMERLETRDFPPNKMEALVEAAQQTCQSTTWISATEVIVTDAHMVALGKALAGLKGQS